LAAGSSFGGGGFSVRLPIGIGDHGLTSFLIPSSARPAAKRALSNTRRERVSASDRHALQVRASKAQNGSTTHSEWRRKRFIGELAAAIWWESDGFDRPVVMILSRGWGKFVMIS
jgi:hypothetical protein